MGFLTKKIPLFTAFGIRVFLHPIWIIVFVLRMLQALQGGYVLWELWAQGVLWGSVLLHEFGHCWGARRMGGDAREILMWPLGGLAMVEAPMTPWAQFVVTFTGPLVNLILAPLFFGLTYVVPEAWGIELYDKVGMWPHGLVRLIYGTNLALLIFNMIPAFPMDMGRMLQCALWWKLGYRRATTFAVYLSFACAGAMVVYGLTMGNVGTLGGGIFIALAIWVAQSAYNELLMLRQGAYDDLDEPWRRTYWYEEAGEKSPGFFEKIRKQRAEARAQAEAQETERRAERLDEVLRRVAEVGMDGLTVDERTFLDQESARLRNSKR